MHEYPQAATDDADKPKVRFNRSTRTVWIGGRVDADMSEARIAIHDLAMSDGNEGATITLVINSPGGAVDGVFSVMDEMGRMRGLRGVRFVGVAEGLAGSAGLILLQHCDRRLMGRWATLIAHGFTFGQRGDIKDHELLLGLVKAQTRQVAELFAHRTAPVSGADALFWFDAFHSKRDLSYRAPEALREGLVDEVIG